MAAAVQSYSSRTEASLIAQVNYAKAVGRDAVSSNAWFYPLRGVVYFVSHKSLWKPLGKILLPSILVSLGVLIFMFLFTYIPQAAILSIIQLGPLGFVSAVPLVLSESSVIINLLSRTFIIEEKVVEVFDATLIDCGQTRLVEQGREIKRGGASNKLGKAVMKPLQRFSPSALAYYILTLPLQFIPIAGPIIFFVLNGAKSGPGLHSRYFQLKRFSEQERKEFVHRRRGAYTAMGTVALLLNTLPLISVFFAFTNACGAALFAADLQEGAASSPPAQQEDEVEMVSKED